MRKVFKLVLSLLLTGFAFQTRAQVKDVSFTISPQMEYGWWDNNLNLGATPFWGLKVGFGFGPLFELRANYERSINLKSKLQNSDWSFAKQFATNLDDTDVDIDRYGAEMKLNLWSGTLISSYLTGGSGIMHFKYRDLKDTEGKHFREDQLYGNVGLGAKINLHKRIVLALEVKDIMFKANEEKPYLKAGVNYSKLMHNWAALASLDFYLGGYNNPDEADVTKAYRQLFSDGFKGMKFVIEPNIGYWKFADGSSFRDHVFEGVSLGVDFTPLIGLRAFYSQATKHDNRPDFEFNKDLRMYGGNLLARLNSSRSVNPYITLGGGYLDVNSDRYRVRKDTEKAKDGWFLMGGVGLEYPFTRYVSIFASANAMLTEQQNNLDKITKPSSINFGVMYQGGLRFNIGSPADGYAVHRKTVKKAVDERHAADMEELNAMRADYDARIDSLNNEIRIAAAKKDTVKVTELVIRKMKADEISNRIDSLENVIVNMRFNKIMGTEQSVQDSLAKQDSLSRKLIYLTKPQFEQLIDRVVNAVVKSDKGKSSSLSLHDFDQSSLSELDKLILMNALGRQQNNTDTAQEYSLRASKTPQTQNGSAQTQDNNLTTKRIMDRLDQVEKKLDQSLKSSNKIQEVPTTYLSPTPQNSLQGDDVRKAVMEAMKDNSGTSASVQPIVMGASRVQSDYTPSTVAGVSSNRLAIFTGFNVGEIWNWNIGIRMNMQISNTDLDFVPEAYLGLGKKNGYGVSANIVYNLNFPTWIFTPYVGLGLGVFGANHHNRFGNNILLGASMKTFLNGKLYIDYSSHNFFKNNQFSLGYRFNF